MTDTTVILGTDANGKPINIGAIDTGNVTASGQPIYELGVQVVNAADITIGGVTVADGANVVEGATTGAAIVTDANGTLQRYLRGLVKLAATHVAVEVTPAPQVTTDAFADVTGSTLDTLTHLTACYTLVNSDVANSLDWRVLAANAADFSDGVIISGPATVLAAGITSYTANPAPFRYYRVQVQSTVPVTPATAVVHGISKG